MSFFGALAPLFWISGNVSSGFESQSGFWVIRVAEANIMYIPRPLALHIANLLTAQNYLKYVYRGKTPKVIFDIFCADSFYSYSP